MASFPVVSNNGFLIAQGKFKFHVGASISLDRYRCRSCSFSQLYSSSSVSVPVVGWNYSHCSFQYGLSLQTARLKSLIDENSHGETHMVERRKERYRKRKIALRLRPRLRLFWKRFRNGRINSILNGLGTFLRENRRKITLSTSISLVLGLCFFFLKVTAMPTPKAVPYSDLIMSLQNGMVSKVLFEEGTRRIYYSMNTWVKEGTQVSEQGSGNVDRASNGHVKTRLAGGNALKKMFKGRAPTPSWQFSTRKIDHDEGYLLSLMRERGTSYGSAPQSALTSLRNTLITVLTLWIPLAPLMWLLYRQISTARSPAKKRRPSNQLITFQDVEGVDTAKVELLEIVSCLQGSTNYSKLGAKLPRGVLLVGPPGTGKTLLARAVAGEAGVPFFSVSASEFVELFVGRGAARIRDLFNVARKEAPSIIFIDELDAVGGKRGKSFNDERDQTLNQLLTEMDGFQSDVNVVVIAATNRPEALDQALCRPGRFSRKVYVGQPDEIGRKKILAIHFRGVPLEEDLELICNLVAPLTQGFVGADLANIVNEAALLAARRGAECVSREDIMEAIERAKFGINDWRPSSSTLGKELGKLFPWVPSLVGRNDAKQKGLDGPLGYQTLS
ncbi:OLC1v1009910C1 [Oldenlandia corymbosa var. corymbosa]|uniref:ATP-dependent zinc metalloprotease FTSH, chloroplastic n=1 Tax=Oldenlandia corymbosa var. corymbosa TaxID=529605 RepID=A0AAV1DQ30_OLDCO|nr:OLC1v1009910C1 [Oldenlandia corymbosa var. corymbosa]